ncbi:MAG: putative sulfate exporter family transporter [Pseudomonadota bacterium]
MTYSPPKAALARALTSAKTRVPGLSLAVVIGLAASYLAEHYGGPAMLFALLLGIAFNYLSDDRSVSPGVVFASRGLLRIAVVLLGARLTLGEVQDLGSGVVLLVLAGVVVGLLGGMAIARALGLTRPHAVLSAGAVSICGASAALAIASVLPQDGDAERNTTITVVGVTTLSTIAMTLYPIVAGLFGLPDRAAGIFLGATIHDVAQVIGAGYIISDLAGETAAVVKLLRVACLMPVVLAISLVMRASAAAVPGKRPPLLPWFVIGFVVLMLVNSANLLPPSLVAVLGSLSQMALVIAVAALGVRTSLAQFTGVGVRPLLAMVAQTLLLAVFVLAGVTLLVSR